MTVGVDSSTHPPCRRRMDVTWICCRMRMPHGFRGIHGSNDHALKHRVRCGCRRTAPDERGILQTNRLAFPTAISACQCRRMRPGMGAWWVSFWGWCSHPNARDLLIQIGRGVCSGAHRDGPAHIYTRHTRTSDTIAWHYT